MFKILSPYYPYHLSSPLPWFPSLNYNPLLSLFCRSQIVILFSPSSRIARCRTAPVLKAEANYVANLGATAKADTLHAIYNVVLNKWFPPSAYYAIDRQALCRASKSGRKSFARHAGNHPDPLLIVELKRPAKWNDAGKQEVLEHLTESIQAQLHQTQYNTIYGLGGIGLYWMVCKMERDGLPVPTTVVDWHNDISSDLSYDAFEAVAALIYNIC